MRPAPCGQARRAHRAQRLVVYLDAGGEAEDAQQHRGQRLRPNVARREADVARQVAEVQPRLGCARGRLR